mgnify:FL=1
MKQPLPSKKNRSLMSSLWCLRHGPLNLLKIIELLIELPLAVPHCLLCVVADGLDERRKKTGPSRAGGA